MQFRVPQFLDIEDKIFGPFTFRQFGYMLGGVAFAYIFWKLLPIYISIPLVIVVSGTFLCLAFVEINGRKFGDVMEAAVKYFLNSKVYVWQKNQPQINSLQYNQKKFNEAERLREIEKEKKLKENQIINGVKRGEIKHFTFDQIKEISKKLDVLNEKTTNGNVDLRDRLLKERNGFRL